MPPGNNSQPTTNDQQNQEPSLKQIRTFQGDVVEALRRQQESLVSIQQREHLKQSSTQLSTNASPENSKKIRWFLLFFVGSLLFLTVGSVGAWYAYNEFVRKTSPPITEIPANRFLSSNSEVTLKLGVISREALINIVTGATGDVPQGELRHIILKQDAVDNNESLFSTNEFLQRLESRAPSSLVRAFDPLFMFGALGKSSTTTNETNTFLIIKLASFENAFAGMLSWEQNLSRDIGPLFATAPLIQNLSPEPVFTDLVDRNKDIRILKRDGQTVLLYSFFDNKVLIITDSVETLRTLIDRLTREKLSR